MNSLELWDTATEPDLAVTTRGAVPPADVTRAVRAIGRVLRRHHLDAAAHVRVTAPADADAPTVVQANIHSRDTRTRVQVPGPRGFAVTFAAERLDRQIARLGADPTPRVWPDPARPPLARVTEQRPITRRKDYALVTSTPAQAIEVLDAMDYDVHLFTDAATGEEAVVHWIDPDGVHMIRQHTTDPIETAPAPMALTVDAAPAPRLDEGDAATQLCWRGLPFLFYTDARTGRGHLLYRRYDGDLALVRPAR
ncbi:sigma 54 modulation/S30EA ribosomal C-terminal domain-containing protein [Nocardia cyriacigeorgica]|uniref:sigma 54 modulation/S30EA ribosomal C-terminal domain-containing protein n=1 Tax=Nocardia cyriacigeorgica TaxID=135487 RepID=UPI0002DD0DF2|nr:sigma 54 modulation/S30EA ribosomal C-terminal domain-containing protein [Nocardia cyriacigeorgica]AVH24255.1 hypothetical protein C5B73_25405 [Nocardia cyriacigeorgica]MBF6323812.1 sigma 54 modulation/S30EA ribosomal C-terminal domain-containing protein [Nocardia cyriacigeorgica]MBF6496232.1 sigma 54 modulation/S30EA ribosomal C-terminal domain-containing protein [Nocardia cyriacigeorgica]PPJ16138.1 hypothetical protein C5E43_03690 [Nocardia cyriacigeorgica]TLF55165.1 hypothetical protein 